MSTTLIIARREFRSFFDSALAYVVISISLILLGFVFFEGFWQEGRASVSRLVFLPYPYNFSLLPLLLSVIVTPVVTMRAIAEERRSGTLEMLITLPVKDHSVILGKYIASYGLVLVLLLATALYPIFLFHWPWHLGNLDNSAVFSAYLGMALCAAASVSVGLLVSSLTESQVVAFFLTFFVLLGLHLIDRLTAMVGASDLRIVTTFISFDARLTPFARGMINTRDVIYFLSVTIGCLMAAFRALERRKWT